MPRIYDQILIAALNSDIPTMLTFLDHILTPAPHDLSWPAINTFFLEVVLGPHLDLLTPDEMMRPDPDVYPLLARRLREKLINLAVRGDERSVELLETFELEVMPEEAGMTRDGQVRALKGRVLEVLCRLL